MTLETSGRAVCREESISVSHDRQQSARSGRLPRLDFGVLRRLQNLGQINLDLGKILKGP